MQPGASGMGFIQDREHLTVFERVLSFFLSFSFSSSSSFSFSFSFFSFHAYRLSVKMFLLAPLTLTLTPALSFCVSLSSDGIGRVIEILFGLRSSFRMG